MKAIKLSSDILDSKFNNDVLDTLVPNLVPNLNKLELLSREVLRNPTIGASIGEPRALAYYLGPRQSTNYKLLT
jgi:hypothetical protein